MRIRETYAQPRSVRPALPVMLAVLLLGTLMGACAAPESSDESTGDVASAQPEPPAEAGWSGWRGPQRTAKSPDTGLLSEWPEGGPPLLWQAEGLGNGFSSVAVVDGTIYTLGDEFIEGEGEELEGGDEYAMALDAGDGTIRWRTRVGAAWAESSLYPGSRSTPSVSGDAVVVLASDGNLSRLNAANGEIVWTRDLSADFSGEVAPASAGVHWTYSESPLIDGDRVIASPGVPGAALVALRLADGSEIWRTEVPDLGEIGADGAGYSSVRITEGGGVRQYVQLIGKGLVGVRAEDGEFLWGYNRVANNVANIPTPLVDGDFVFASTGYRTGAALLELAPTEDGGVSASEVYFLEGETFQNHHGGMILHEGVVYAGTAHNRGFPIAVEMATGNILWGPERNEGRGSAAVAFADGKLYMRYQNGLMLLVDASPDGYVERGSFEIPDVDDPSWSHPVILDGRLYLREQDRIFVYDVSAPPTS